MVLYGIPVVSCERRYVTGGGRGIDRRHSYAFKAVRSHLVLIVIRFNAKDCVAMVVP